MELTPKQQIKQAIDKAQNILLVTHKSPDGDGLGASLAFYLMLKKLGKQATAVCLDTIPENLKFLPLENLKKDFQGLADFVISIDVKNTTVDKLRYNIKDGKLNIILTPKEGKLAPEQVNLGEGKLPFDLIILLDVPNIEQLGELYDKNTALFFDLPTVNIDHHASNEYLGKINLVDLTATSTCEILVALFESFGEKLIDETIATCLLTGIITDTGSFQNTNTTPKSLSVAAQLIGFGAEQQKIIRSVFKTKPLSMLKLWGEALTKIQRDAKHSLVWSTLSYDEFKKAHATKQDTDGLINDLLSSAPDTDIVLLLSEKEPKTIHGSVRTREGIDAAKIAGLFGGGGHPGAAGFMLEDKELKVAEKFVLEQIRTYQERRITNGKVE